MNKGPDRVRALLWGRGVWIIRSNWFRAFSRRYNPFSVFSGFSTRLKRRLFKIRLRQSESALAAIEGAAYLPLILRNQVEPVKLVCFGFSVKAMLPVPTTHKCEVFIEGPLVHESSCRVSEVDVVVEVVILPARIKRVGGTRKRASIRSASSIRRDVILERHLDRDKACVWIGQADKSDRYVDEIGDPPAAIIPMNFSLGPKVFIGTCMSALIPWSFVKASATLT
jgi:hypothetical protein